MTAVLRRARRSVAPDSLCPLRSKADIGRGLIESQHSDRKVNSEELLQDHDRARRCAPGKALPATQTFSPVRQAYVATFGFGPGAGRGEYPDTRHCKASILLPFSKRVKLHVMISPAAARLARFSRTIASDMPVSSAISKSRHCPCFFRHCRTCFTTQTMNRVENAGYLSPQTSPVG